MLKGRLDPTGKILLDFEKWEENVISAADDGFYGQASELVPAKAMKEDRGGVGVEPHGEQPTDELPREKLNNNKILRRKGESGSSGKRRKLVKHFLRRNEINEVRGESRKLRRRVLRPKNTFPVKVMVTDGKDLKIGEEFRTRILKGRPSHLGSIDIDPKVARVSEFDGNMDNVFGEQKDGGEGAFSGGLREGEGGKMVKGRGKTGTKTNGKLGRAEIRGDGEKVRREEGSNITRGEARVRKLVKRKKLSGRRLGGRRIDSGEREKVEKKVNEVRKVKTGTRVEEKEERDMPVTVTKLWRKVRRKIRRRQRVENWEEASSLKNSARQLEDTFTVPGVDTLPSTNSAIEVFHSSTWSSKTLREPTTQAGIRPQVEYNVQKRF